MNVSIKELKEIFHLVDDRQIKTALLNRIAFINNSPKRKPLFTILRNKGIH
jgi:hypothetical protein